MGEPAVVTIRHQVLEVDLCGSEADGHALQRRLPAVCADVISPAVEAALGGIDAREAYLYLDRLAIEVTLASLDELNAQLGPAVQRAIKDNFRRHPLPPVDRYDLVDGAGWGDDPGAPRPPGDVRRRSVGQAVDEALVAFLRSGRLPWSFRLPPGRTLEQLVVDTWSDSGGHPDPPPAIRQRLPAVLALAEARERLLAQFTPGFVMTLLRSLSPEAAARVEQVEAALRGLSPTSADHRSFTRQVRAVAIAAVIDGRLPAPSAMVKSVWNATSPALRADHPLAAALDREWPGITEPVHQLGAVVAAEPPRARAVAADGHPAEAGGLLVEGAGLVLVHPFLPRFLAGLGVAVGDELVDPGRALCLLDHLVTGELTAPEHRLTLAKVLCGVPLERPVEADVGLTDAETGEATALLEAAIGHWEALRGTSPDGLRLEFLQRPGVLSMTADDEWLLRVEARTVDILLDRLPWGFSPLRLPWMNRLLMVEWR